MLAETAAARAKSLLKTASQRLHTANPVEQVGDVLEDAMPFPVGDRAYRGARLLEPQFSETASDNLSFVMSTGAPKASASDHLETATRTMSRLVRENFGPEALHWLEGRVEPALSGYATHRWGASFGAGYDRDGMRESLISVEWGPQLMDSLPAALYRIARTTVDLVPGLRPVMSTIRCGRSSGSQQITFEIGQALPLENLRPLMEALGLGHQHASLMSATAFVLGARFTLPPETANLTLRPLRNGVEMRLDVILDALPDVPPQLMSLMRLQMAERPRSLRALERWFMALTPEGCQAAGDLSILSVWVRPEMPARLALYLRPAALGQPPEHVAPPLEAGVAAGAGTDEWGRL